MPRPVLLLLLPALLAACGQVGSTTPGVSSPGTSTPAPSAQQALPGVFQIDFNGVGTDAPTTQVQTLKPSGLGTQGLISAPDQFSFSQAIVQTFAVAATGIRHVRVTYKVTNTSTQTLRNPKLIAVVPQGSTTDSVFTNVRYFDGSDASAAIGKLSLVQGQNVDPSTNSAVADAKANALLTGLDVSQVDTTGKGIKTLTQTGWWLTTVPAPGGATLMAPGDSAFITFGVNVPMTPVASGGASKDPFSFSLNVTAVQDTQPLVAMSSAVKQWDATSKTFGNYVKFPTQTYIVTKKAITQSLPAYYDVSSLDGSTTAKVLCGGDADMDVTKLTTNTINFPNRWRVQLLSLGDHTLNVFEGASCPATGKPLLSQSVTGVSTGGNTLARGASGNHGLVVLTDGTVQSWGSNKNGELGNGSTMNRTVPGKVAGLTNIVSVTAGAGYSLALKADGTVQSWGDNRSGQLGDGTTIQRLTPVSVSNLSDIVAISSGADHNLALRADGTVQSWGGNSFRQLGDGSTNNRTIPSSVSGLTGIASVSAGSGHSLTLKANGTVQVWGDNFYARDSALYGTPVNVSELSGIASIAAGGQHDLVLKADGTVQGWGENLSGQVGDGSPGGQRLKPVNVFGLTDVISIAAGDEHSLALKGDGTVQSWGHNGRGELGRNTDRGSNDVPTSIPGLVGVTSISAGSQHSLALKADGTVQGWGYNNSGALGDGTTDDRKTPVNVSGLIGVAQPTP